MKDETLVLTTKEEISAYRLLALRSGLKLELKGMKVSRGKTCYSVIKKEFQLTGSREVVLRKYEQILRDNNILSEEK